MSNNSTTVLRLKPDVTLEELQRAIEVAVDVAGCPGCGLNGFDLKFEIDPRVRWASVLDKLRDVVRDIDVVVNPAFDGSLGRTNGR
jgi:hypothetical protein